MPSTSPSSTTPSDRRTGGLRRAPLAAALAACLALGAAPPGGDPPRFTDIAGESGLRFRHTFGAEKLESILMTTGSGCALFDYDDDGFLDAFLVNGTYLDEKGQPRADKKARHALFHNEGDGTYRNVTRTSGIGEPTYGQGVACADYDGDGLVDLYLTNYGPNRLYRNLGGGRFEDATEKSGTGDPRWGTGAIFFDLDGDGDLDLYVANYVKYSPDMKGRHASEISKRMGFRFFPGPRDYEDEDDVLFRNGGDGTFTDATKEAGLRKGGKGLSVVACDLDGNGTSDVFVANDASPNFLYRNDGGKLEEIARVAGVAFDPDGAETAAMGVDIADVNGDGRPDLYVTNMVFEFNNLYQNGEDLLFEDVTKAIGLDVDNYRHVGWTTRFADFNLDGHLDCFVANGHVVDYVEGFSQSITYGQQNMMFLGGPGGRFEEVSDRCGPPFERKRVSRGGAFGDVDNDGDVDILLVNSGGRGELLRNDTPRSDRWVKVRLKGRAPNTHGIGAWVVVKMGDRKVEQECRFPTGYLSSSDPTIHVGLPPKIAGVSVEVAWPSGKKSSTEVKAGTLAVIEEPGE